MEAYTLDWQKGQLIQDRMQEANYKRISDKKIDDTMKVQIMNLKEYEQIKEYIPHKKNLLYSMNHVRYCKVDSFHDCVQGIMRVPDLKNKPHQLHPETERALSALSQTLCIPHIPCTPLPRAI